MSGYGPVLNEKVVTVLFQFGWHELFSSRLLWLMCRYLPSSIHGILALHKAPLTERETNHYLPWPLLRLWWYTLLYAGGRMRSFCRERQDEARVQTPRAKVLTLAHRGNYRNVCLRIVLRKARGETSCQSPVPTSSCFLFSHPKRTAYVLFLIRAC